MSNIFDPFAKINEDRLPGSRRLKVLTEEITKAAFVREHEEMHRKAGIVFFETRDHTLKPPTHKDGICLVDIRGVRFVVGAKVTFTEKSKRHGCTGKISEIALTAHDGLYTAEVELDVPHAGVQRCWYHFRTKPGAKPLGDQAEDYLVV